MKRIFTNMKRIFTIVIIPTAVSAIISFILQYTDTLQDVLTLSRRGSKFQIIPAIIAMCLGIFVSMIFNTKKEKEEPDPIDITSIVAVMLVSIIMNS